MKALKSSVSVAELQKLLRLWKSRNITDSVSTKLLDLYLGQTAYMNEERVYPVENFYDLCTSMRFKNTAVMIGAVKQCGSFGIVSGNNIYATSSFCSPLWNSECFTSTAAEGRTKSGILPGTLPGTCPADNIYNIYTKGDSSNEELSPTGDTEPTADSSKENIVTPESLAAAKEFFHLINKTPSEKAQLLTPLINWFQLHEKLTRQHACDNLVYLVNELLIPYFAGQARFMKSNHAGRICWLSNLIKSAHGQRLLNEAACQGRKIRQQAVVENRNTQRSNHPVSEFEWTDPESGLRFYDDAVEGAVNIPDGAQPRPSAEAIWNVLSKEWTPDNNL